MRKTAYNFLATASLSLILGTFLAIFSSFSTKVVAQNLESDNYRIIDPSIDAGGNDDASSGTYNLLDSIGGSINDERFESSNYKLGTGIGYTFMANVPVVTYFQTDDSAMIALCGEGGCYNRAKFELDPENNPTETLYLVEISTDDWTTVQCIDGTTKEPKAISSKNINDYLTEATWEAEDFNLLGLASSTEYKIRLRALNGDFTESEPGPDATESTTDPSISFDINISGDTWASTSAPYEIDSWEITTVAPSTADDLIWLDMGTNAVAGAIIQVRDTNQGLLSSYTGESIDSISDDLSSVSEGFGLKVDTSKTLPATGQPGYFIEASTYDTAGAQEVGELYATPTIIFCTRPNSGDNCSTGTGEPISGARSGIWLKARAAPIRSAASDYTDQITFTAIGTF
ncbi:hypothetical protein JW710_01080 [Candidatus Dojkabacteria bacterium]|nr:hypothetical protein [Candidatus Dojkabacteria bacterium]